MEFDRIREIAAGILEIPVDQIRPESRLGEDLCADSLQVCEIILAVEEEFQVEFQDLNIDDVITAEELYNKLCALKK